MRTILRARAIHTLDPRRPRAEALLIEGGRIAALGSDADAGAWRRPGDRVLDWRDAVAVPGLVDYHLHLRGYGLQLSAADLHGVRSVAEACARVAAHARTLPAGAWVTGRGWDRNRFDDPRWPTAAELTAAVGDRPAVLGSVDGHAAWATPAALAAAGIARGRGDEPGGRVLRDADGTPSGVVFERTVDRLRAAVPPPDAAAQARAVRAAATRLAALGLTAVWTMDGADDLGAALAADAEAPLPLRVHVHLLPPDLPHAAARRLRAGIGAGRVTLAGLKIYADGALGTQTAWMLEPYEGTADHGIPVTPPDALARLAREGCAAGLPPCVHAIGDAAVRAVLDAIEAVAPAVRAALPFAPRVEHAQCIHPADVPRFARLGVDASVQPRHIPLDVPVADRWWGARAATRAYPLRRLAAAGAVLRLGTDAPVVPPDPGPNWAAAVARLPAAGEGGDRPWHPAEALSLAQAVAASVAGPLEPGAPADVTVLDVDPLVVPSPALASLRAVCTISGGLVTAAG